MDAAVRRPRCARLRSLERRVPPDRRGRRLADDLRRCPRSRRRLRGAARDARALGGRAPRALARGRARRRAGDRAGRRRRPRRGLAAGPQPPRPEELLGGRRTRFPSATRPRRRRHDCRSACRSFSSTDARDDTVPAEMSRAYAERRDEPATTVELVETDEGPLRVPRPGAPRAGRRSSSGCRDAGRGGGARPRGRARALPRAVRDRGPDASTRTATRSGGFRMRRSSGWDDVVDDVGLEARDRAGPTGSICPLEVGRPARRGVLGASRGEVLVVRLDDRQPVQARRGRARAQPGRARDGRRQLPDRPLRARRTRASAASTAMSRLRPDRRTDRRRRRGACDGATSRSSASPTSRIARGHSPTYARSPMPHTTRAHSCCWT